MPASPAPETGKVCYMSVSGSGQPGWRWSDASDCKRGSQGEVVGWTRYKVLWI
jgi:hypothetical protein